MEWLASNCYFDSKFGSLCTKATLFRVNRNIERIVDFAHIIVICLLNPWSRGWRMRIFAIFNLVWNTIARSARTFVQLMLDCPVQDAPDRTSSCIVNNLENCGLGLQCPLGWVPQLAKLFCTLWLECHEFWDESKLV